MKHAEKQQVKQEKLSRKQVEKAVEATKEQAHKLTTSVEDFAADLGGLPLDRAKTFYDEGIKSAARLQKLDRKRTPCLERNRSSYYQEIKRKRHQVQVIFLVPCISVKNLLK